MKEKRKIFTLKHLWLLLVFCLGIVSSFAQQADEELAAQFLGNREYNKAADMYERLLNKNPRSMYFYDNLLKCYLNQEKFTDAQKLVKKQSKKFEQNSFYQVDQGYLLALQKENQKAENLYNGLIQKMRPLENEIYELSKAYEKRNENQFAIQTFIKGRKILNNNLVFASDLASLYSEVHDLPSMIEEYLNVLVLDQSYISEVQGFLQNSLQNNQEFDLLKVALQKRIKQYPELSTFSEMLIWLHVQRNEYEQAVIYAKAIDKKYREDGRRIMELGFLATANEKFDAAISIYKQVELLGKEKPYYSMAKNGEIEARAKKILGGNYTQDELKNLAHEYDLLLLEFGRNPNMAETMRDLANLKAFYLNNYTEAIKDYEEIINMPRVDRNLLANCKLELADFYVMKGEVWDAMLLYGQVDKDFLQEPLGQEAKFRNAKLSYYLGEFDWAKAQLDILKTATTQLIANNALELSLLIQDNSVDSNTEPLYYFAQADLNFVQNYDDVALAKLDSINILFPKHSLSDDILYKKAQIFMKRKDYKQAAKYYEIVTNDFGSDILGDNALYELARLNQYQFKDLEGAKKLYEKFIDTYPGSFFLTDCRKQFRLLRGDQLN
jgi:tetratricopeptide (TPR) repeat protein